MADNYTSTVQIGKDYQDDLTGFVGTASAVAFYAGGEVRVQLEVLDEPRSIVREEWFNESRLVLVN